MVYKLLILSLVLVCVTEVLGDGYGGHSYMVPGGSRGRKWQIRARGKGMQNMMQMYYPKKEEKKKEVVYYPVPVYEHEGGYGGGGGGGGYGGGGGGGYGGGKSMYGGY